MISFKTHNGESNIDVNETCLQGYIKISYDDLVNIFGKPTNGDGYKVDAEWLIETDKNTVITIYNYKDGINYCGSDGTPTKDIIDWHIGGHDQKCIEELGEIVGDRYKIISRSVPFDEYKTFMEEPLPETKYDITRDIYNNLGWQHEAWQFCNHHFDGNLLDLLIGEDVDGNNLTKQNIDNLLDQVEDLGTFTKEEWKLFFEKVREWGI